MSDCRVIEIVVSVIGTKYNMATDEPGNKIIPIRKLILVDETMTVEGIAEIFSVAITRIEEEN